MLNKIIWGIVLIVIGVLIAAATFLTLFFGKYLGDIIYMLLWAGSVILIILGIKFIVTNRHR